MIFTRLLYKKDIISGGASGAKPIIDSSTQAFIDASVKSPVSAVSAATKASTTSQSSLASGLVKGAFKIPATLWSTSKVGVGIVMGATVVTAAGAYAGWDGSFLPTFDFIKPTIESALGSIKSGFDSIKDALPKVTWEKQPPSGGNPEGVDVPSQDVPSDSPKGPKTPEVIIDGNPGSGKGGGAGGLAGIIAGIRGVGKTIVTIPMVVVSRSLAGVGAAVSGSGEHGGEVIKGGIVVVGLAATAAVGVGIYYGFSAVIGCLKGLTFGFGKTNEKLENMDEKLGTIGEVVGDIQADIHQINTNAAVMADQLNHVNTNIANGVSQLQSMRAEGERLVDRMHGFEGEVFSLNATLTESGETMKARLTTMGEAVGKNATAVADMDKTISGMSSAMDTKIAKMFTAMDTKIEGMLSAMETAMASNAEVLTAAVTESAMTAVSSALTSLPEMAAAALAPAAVLAAAAAANVSPPAAAGSDTTYQDRGTSAGPGPATPPRGSSSSGGQQGMATEGGGVLGTRGYTPAASHSLFSMAAGGNPGADILRLSRFWIPSVPIANPAQQVRPVSAPVSSIPSSSRSRDQTSEISDLAVSAAKRTLDNVRKSAR